MGRRNEPRVCLCGAEMRRVLTASNFLFKKRWIPTDEGWKRGDM